MISFVKKAELQPSAKEAHGEVVKLCKADRLVMRQATSRGHGKLAE